MDIRLHTGERGIFIGKTGSGKTRGAIFVLQQYKGNIIILDTKIEPQFISGFNPYETDVFTGLQPLDKMKDKRIAIVRPTPEEIIDPDYMDSWLFSIYENAPYGTCLYIDEVYSVHKGGQLGIGGVALLTRGRSRGIAVLMSTQRPSWISRFCLSEAERYYCYRLNDHQDRKRMAEFMGKKALDIQSKYHFLFYDVGQDEPIVFKPVPLINYAKKENP